jgi:transcriptional regulator with XRE-family HTH domain
MAHSQNIVGDQIRRLRSQTGLTQEQLAARCQVLGLQLSRGALSKIEAGLRCVVDYELPPLAKALNVALPALFPAKPAPSPAASSRARAKSRR